MFGGTLKVWNRMSSGSYFANGARGADPQGEAPSGCLW